MVRQVSNTKAEREKIKNDIREGVIIEDNVGRHLRVVDASTYLKSNGLVGCIPAHREDSDDLVITQNIAFRRIERIVSQT